MNQDQIDLVAALRTISNELADYVYDKFTDEGKTFDQIHFELREAVKLVDGWRIGRGV